MRRLTERFDWQFDNAETWRSDPWIDRSSNSTRIGDDDLGPMQVNEPSDVIPGNTSTPFSVAIGGSNTGAINFLGDRDWFSVSLVAGQTYDFALFGAGATPIDDTYLYVYNSSGVLVAFNDDIDYPFDFSSGLAFTATSTGTYYLGAGGFDDSETGSYTITAALNTSTPLDSINWQETMSTNAIDVYFATLGNNFNGETTIRDWTASEIDAAMEALGTFSTFLPFTFTQVGSPTGAELVLSIASIGALGYFEVGTPYGFFDPAGAGWNAIGLEQGGYGFVTMIHELGHGFGLAHPHDNGGGSTIMPGVTGPFNSYGTHGLNQGVWTMMSYNDGWPTGPLPQPSTSGLGWEGTPMALDIAMLQQFYGANMSYHAGADTYTLTNAMTAFTCIWDAGGADTIAYAGAAACTIDLRAATLQYETGGAGWVSYVAGVSSGFTIANGVVIENATGGSGADNLIGNSAANILNGGASNDTLNGGAGADQLFGGDGDDTIFWDAGDVLANVQGGVGTDTLVFLGGAAPTTFNLATHGFERAEGRLTDAGSEPWATQTLVYDALWRLDTETTVFDDAAHAFHDYDQTSQFGWSDEWTRYDALNRVDVIVTTFDDASYSNNNYDQADGFVWSSEWTHYDALNRVDTVFTTFDDATYSINEFDVAGTQAWITQWTHYDGLDRVDTVFTTFDDSSHSINEFDVAGAQTWVTQWTLYDDQDRVDTVVTTYDDGTYAINDYDQANEFSWASQFWLYNSSDQVIGYQLIPDGGG